jgi:exodeoxyribonuclease X
MSIARVIDFETTGTDHETAKVCEVGLCDVHIEERRVDPPRNWLCGVSSMPPEARAVHHISARECEGFPPFDPESMFVAPCTVVVAHNSDFEVGFFVSPVPVICTYKAALRVWPHAPAHNNGTLRYWLEDQGKIAPDHALTQPAHRAGPDAYTTAHILLALLDAGATGRQMAAWTQEPKLLPACPIGKFRGMPWPDVEQGFLWWMLRQTDMDADLKWNAKREIDRRFGQESPA